MVDTTTKAGSNGLTLVTGGTGKTGRRVVERLRAAGRAVRVGSRRGTPAFDWADESTWAGALEGVSAVYLAYLPDLSAPGALGVVRRFLDAMKRAGAGRVVLISDRGEPSSQEAEKIVARSGLEWTVVRCAWFHQNFDEGEFMGMVMDGLLTLPAGAVKEGFVDADDIAAVAVAALIEDGHKGEVYEVTGPELLGFDEVVTILSEVTGRAVRYQAVTMTEFGDGLREAGVPEDFVQLLSHILETLDGRNQSLGDGVQRALGRPAKPFADYARRVGAAGAWNAVGESEVARG